MADTATRTIRSRQILIPAIVGGGSGALVAALVLLIAAPDSEEIVREGLLSDPQVLVEASDLLSEQQNAVRANRAALETPFNSSWKGADRPDAVLVEFFDYACTYCRAAQADIERLLSEDKGLRVVYREFPILGSASDSAARMSLAASKAGRFREYHDTLFAEGRPNSEAVTQAANAAGIEPKVREDPEVEAEISRNRELASELGITGTPSFVVGDRVVKGAVGYEALKKAIAAARKR